MDSLLKSISRRNGVERKMNLKTVLTVCVKLLISKEKENPGGAFKTPQGEIPYKQAIEGVRRVRDWCFPELNANDIQLVTRCQRCIHYKKYKKKGSLKPVFRYLCEIDKAQRPPDFFCANGEGE